MRPYIQSNPNTRICTTSATNAANCRTCLLDKSSVLVHSPSTVLLALHQRFRVGGSIRVKGSRMGTCFPTLPYPYSEHAYRSSESVRNRRAQVPSADVSATARLYLADRMASITAG